jgi:hypothetical protein
MAKPELPLAGGWLRLTSARSGNEGKGLLIHASDIFALHEGSEAGTTLIEFPPEIERAPELVYKSFDTFVRAYTDAWDARGRRPRKRGAQKDAPKVLAFKRS